MIETILKECTERVDAKLAKFEGESNTKLAKLEIANILEEEFGRLRVLHDIERHIAKNLR